MFSPACQTRRPGGPPGDRMDQLACADMRKFGKRANTRPQRSGGRLAPRQTLRSALGDLSNRSSFAGGWKHARFNFLPTACCLPLWRPALRSAEWSRWHRPLRRTACSAFSNALRPGFVCFASQSVKLSGPIGHPLKWKSRPCQYSRPRASCCAVAFLLRCGC